MATQIPLSLVVPVFDEEPNLWPLHAEIRAALDPQGRDWEALYVDDGSRDGSLRALRELQAADRRVRIVQLKRNSGQTAALAAGFEHARGRVVVTLDADLQNDPADIPRLVEELGRGFDVVTGWRQRRHDGFLLRRLPSLLANRLIARVTGVRIHDTGCTLKAFRREAVRGLVLYSDQHRFLPALVAGAGGRVGELVVNHRPRRFGRSKYGLSRAGRVLLDLLALQLTTTFSQRPLRYFALLALPFALGALVALASAGAHLASAALDEAAWRAAATVFALFAMVSVFLLLLGFLAELAVKAGGVHARPGAALVPGAER
jgi:glycosyltransferase involved in cell wall biosynthesis